MYIYPIKLIAKKNTVKSEENFVWWLEQEINAQK